MNTPKLWAILCAQRRSVRRFVRRVRRFLQDQLMNSFARVRRKQLRHVTFIGVTGSCGKTTTTRLAGAVLGSASHCCMSAGDNGHPAVIKNVLSVRAYTKFCIQEVAGSQPGRIARHFRVLKPHIGIVTTIGSDHYRNFRSLEATAREKGQLVELLPSTGIAILNADDPYVLALASRTFARVIKFGRSPDADIGATQVSSVWPDRLALTVTDGHDTIRIRTKLVGEFWTTSVLAAITCGLACGIDLKDCARVVEMFEPMFGRHSVHVKPNGPVYIFDHKAPFWTIPASLAFVASARTPRKTIVFGTISDYAGKAGRVYRNAAREALAVADRVIFVGRQSSHVDKLRQGEVRDRLFTFQTTYQAATFLSEEQLPEELVYIRGSIGADHLERIMLSQLDRVVCWRERCRKKRACHECKHYRTRTPPPFGVAQSTPTT